MSPPLTMLTVLTQMPAFISVNRSDRLPHRPADACGNLDSRFNQHVRPILKRARQRPLQKSYLFHLQSVLQIGRAGALRHTARPARAISQNNLAEILSLRDNFGRKAETFLLAPV